jgi:hypothetical protein
MSAERGFARSFASAVKPVEIASRGAGVDTHRIDVAVDRYGSKRPYYRVSYCGADADRQPSARSKMSGINPVGRALLRPDFVKSS